MAELERSFVSTIVSLRQVDENPERSTRLAKAASMWTRTLLTRPTALFVTKLAPEGNSLAIEAGLVVHAREAAVPLNSALTEYFTTDTSKPAEVTIAGRHFLALPTNADQPIELQWGANDGYLVIGVGSGVLEKLVARLDSKQEPAWLNQLKSDLPIRRRSILSYLNINLFRKEYAPLAGPQVQRLVTTLGLDQISALMFSSGLDESGIVSRSLLAYGGPPRGLLALAEGDALTSADLKHIPDDSLVAACAVP